ncbi:MAG: cation diffusion facilitator family transporter [Bacteroidales bacterium]|nr:cation diffusion facilitator family transporter [Bacteroidales bacterium]
MGNHHDHHHHTHEISAKNIGIAIFLNIIISVSQIIGGIISGSMALLTDALHNFSDVISLSISWFTNRMAKRKSTIKQTFGYKRAEILSAFINSATLIAIAFYLIIEAVDRFSNPQPVLSDLVIYFAIGSIIINTISVLLLHKDAKESMNMRSSYLHLLSDVMTSIGVMIGGFIMKYYGIFWIDSLLSVLIAFYLIFSTYKLLIDSLKILMQFSPKNIDIMDIGEKINHLAEVKNIHHVHLWQLNDKDLFFEAHIDLENDISITDFQLVLKDIESILATQNIFHFNIQPEYSVDDGKDFIVQH